MKGIIPAWLTNFQTKIIAKYDQIIENSSFEFRTFGNGLDKTSEMTYTVIVTDTTTGLPVSIGAQTGNIFSVSASTVPGDYSLQVTATPTLLTDQSSLASTTFKVQTDPQGNGVILTGTNATGNPANPVNPNYTAAVDYTGTIATLSDGTKITVTFTETSYSKVICTAQVVVKCELVGPNAATHHGSFTVTTDDGMIKGTIDPNFTITLPANNATQSSGPYAVCTLIAGGAPHNSSHLTVTFKENTLNALDSSPTAKVFSVTMPEHFLSKPTYSAKFTGPKGLYTPAKLTPLSPFADILMPAQLIKIDFLDVFGRPISENYFGSTPQVKFEVEEGEAVPNWSTDVTDGSIPLLRWAKMANNFWRKISLEERVQWHGAPNVYGQTQFFDYLGLLSPFNDARGSLKGLLENPGTKHLCDELRVNDARILQYKHTWIIRANKAQADSSTIHGESTLTIKIVDFTAGAANELDRFNIQVDYVLNLR